jgi:ABC-type molybdate transport system substrate-binding protein
MRNIILCACLLLLASCPQQPRPAASPDAANPASQPGAKIKPVTNTGPALTVWADPALLPALEALAPEFKKIYSAGYTLEPVERGDLLARLDHTGGTALPAVICADQLVVEQYSAKQQLVDSSRRTFAGDRLVLAERPGQGYAAPSLFDIYELRFKQFGLGEPGTLAGYFGEQALISEGGFDRIKDRVKRYPSSTALVDALKLDVVQVILVPDSSAAVNEISAWLAIGEDLHEDIRYQAAASTGHDTEPGVPELLRFLAEDDAVQSQLEGYGLVRREMALIEN